MKIIATLYMSNGNEEVGEMWTETKSFDANEPIIQIFDWVKERVGSISYDPYRCALRKKLVITIDQAAVEECKEG